MGPTRRSGAVSMAEVDFDDYEGVDYTSGKPARVQRFINIAGAVTSVAMVMGLGFWGYQVAVRDVTGIPVVRALEGPMRIAPENPGGEIAAHQGLAVNAIAAVGSALPMPEELTLAPRPAELDLADGAGLEGTEPNAAIMQAVAEATGMGNITMPTRLPSPPTQPAREDMEQTGAASVEGDPVEELIIAAPTIDPTLIPKEMLEDVEPAPAGAVTRSPRPPSRPGTRVAAASAPVAPPAKEVASTTLKTGERLVQLGAFDNEDQARKEWERLTAKFGNLLGEKGRVVQEAQSGGRTFYRLRAQGFSDEADARRFCSALLAENAACIPVANR